MKKNIIIIMGASGDLAKRKLIPALEAIYKKNQLPHNTVIIGTGRTDFTDDAFRDHTGISGEFSDSVFYHQGTEGLLEFSRSFGEVEKTVIFLSLPPFVFEKSVKAIYDEGFRKVSLVIEKPFGYNTKSAEDLNKNLSKYYSEDEIYRIDHYLAKEPVQNILIFRFANRIFEPLWNNHYIESVQISSTETIGVHERAQYFDTSGIIRDMVQNHILQLLTLTTMEKPASLKPKDICKEKLKILHNLKVVDFRKMQYEGYLEEKGVNEGSNTETYAEFQLEIDLPRWKGVPIYIRTGKALKRKGSEIGIVFKRDENSPFDSEALNQNRVIIKVQPSEGIVLDLVNKVPGWQINLQNTNMSFCYNSSFKQEIPEAYQRLLIDALKGDKTLFINAQETEAAWKVLEHVLDNGEVGYYPKGEEVHTDLFDKWIDFEEYAHLCS